MSIPDSPDASEQVHVAQSKLFSPFLRDTRYTDARANLPAMAKFIVCFHCSQPLSLEAGAPVAFREVCEHCSADVHTCRNCEFFDEGAHHECREPQAEWIRDKERANRCDYFRVGSSARVDQGKKSESLAALDALFKK